MRVIGRQSLESFIHRHVEVRSQIDAWLSEVEEAQWQSPEDIKARYSSASFPSNNHAIFNLNGSIYRLETKVSYANQIVLIIGVGTNDDYSQRNLLEGA
jgi:mRNA interferase HigB